METLLQLDGDFAALPDDVRRDVWAWAEKLSPLFKGQTRGRIDDILARISDAAGVSLPTARRKYYGFKKANWRGLVNWARVPKEYKLPPEFVDYWKKLCEDNQRNCKTAWHILINNWRHTDKPIPGYPLKPAASIGGIPAGWSYRNLARYAPSKFELAAARQGRTAAAAFRPLVYTTRVGLECGQVYMFDDLEHDIKVNFLGVNRQAWRPLELCCLDLFSGCKIAYGTKPTIEGDDGAKQKLKERDMRFLLAFILTQIGYRKAGCSLVVEHGTAAIREDLERVLFDCTGGAVSVQRSGIEGAPALLGWYDGRGKGNFRMKAALESHHSLVHNVVAQLPGQMGLDRNAAPEELHGRDAMNKALLKAVESLPPEKVELIKFPFLHHAQFCQILDHIYRFINGRIDHELEGWEQAGLVAQEYRLMETSKTWLPAQSFARLAPEQQALVQQHLEKPGMVRARRLSPAEVWQARSGMVKIPVWFVPDILGQELAVELTLNRSGMFQFEDRDLGAGMYRYLGRAVNREGREELLRDGETYRCFVNPFDVGQLLACDSHGRYIGTCRRLEAVRRDDPEALFRAMGDAAHTEVVRLAEYRARHQADVDAMQADQEWNDKVKAGAAVTPDEKAKASAMKKYRMADLVSDAVCQEESGDLQEVSVRDSEGMEKLL